MLYLRPNETIKEPFAYRYCGWALSAKPNALGYAISDIDDESPAARAGIHDGDTLIAIDEIPVAPLSRDALNELFFNGPETRTLQIRSPDGKTRTTKIKPIPL